MKRAVFFYFINYICKIRVLSTSILEYFRSVGYKNYIEVINNGVEVPEFLANANILPHQLRLLYVGAISKAKGFNKIIEFASLLREEKIQFSIQVIGEWISHDYQEECLNTIKGRDISHLFNFHGLLLGDSKWHAIQNNSLLLVFSEFEGQPISIIECMAFGIVPVAMKVGAIPEMIIHGVDGFLIDSINDACIIIKEVIAKKHDLRIISQNAKTRYINLYKPDLFIKKIINFVSV